MASNFFENAIGKFKTEEKRSDRDGNVGTQKQATNGSTDLSFFQNEASIIDKEVDKVEARESDSMTPKVASGAEVRPVIEKTFDFSKLRKVVTYSPMPPADKSAALPAGSSAGLGTKNSLDTSPSILIEKQSLRVPPARTDTQELLIALNELSRKLSSIENKIMLIEDNILQIENNNNFSDSNLKLFLVNIIKETFEIVTPNNFSSEDLEDGEVVVVTKHAPVKELTRIDKEGTVQLLNGDSKVYISNTFANLSRQLREARKIGENKKEDIISRKERINILSTNSQEDNWAEEDSDSSQEFQKD